MESPRSTSWKHSDAVLLDIETRSTVDLKSHGGRRYAESPNTQILSVSWHDRGTDFLWLPTLPEPTNPATWGMVHEHIPPHVVLHFGPEHPDPLRQAAQSGRPFVAHNAWGFDAFVWAAKMPADMQPASWIDTDPLARAVGLPGGLDKIGIELRREGKHAKGKGALKKFMRAVDPEAIARDQFYDKELKKALASQPGPGDLILIGAYCWDDTCGLLKALWDYLGRHPLAAFEVPVLDAHRELNGDGVRFDVGLAEALKALAQDAAVDGLRRCQELSGGPDSPFKVEKDLRKRDKVFAWIAKQGASIGKSLRKDVVEGLIREVEKQMAGQDPEEYGKAKPDVAVDTDEVESDAAVGDEDGEDREAEEAPVFIPPVVVEFLKARFAALRITRGKIDAAVNRVSGGRIHELLVYFGAHTGRWAGRGMQIHNLPKPKPAVPVWELIDLYEREGAATRGRLGRAFDPARVQEILDAYYPKVLAKDPFAEKATLDDAASALLRGTLLPDEGEYFSAGDYNAIEFRGAGWAADEDKIMQYFRDKVDPYSMMAQKIYGRLPTSKKDPIRQVGKITDLGCLYQLGEKKFGIFAASQGADLEAAGTTPRACVLAFRDEFTKIAGERTGDDTEDGQPIRRGGIWGQLHAAAIRALEDARGNPHTVGPFKFQKVGGSLALFLPSGRPIYYRKASIEQVVPVWEKGKANPRTKAAVVYTSPRGNKFRNYLYGGKYLENAVQGMCRDLLAAAMVEVRRHGMRVRFHVHDELVVSARTEKEARDAMAIMSTPPAWARDFPILVEADTMPRYAKTAPPGWKSFNYENGSLVA
jgi:DNA polymerase